MNKFIYLKTIYVDVAAGLNKFLFTISIRNMFFVIVF